MVRGRGRPFFLLRLRAKADLSLAFWPGGMKKACFFASLIISSVITLRLKRRNALSIDSPWLIVTTAISFSSYQCYAFPKFLFNTPVRIAVKQARKTPRIVRTIRGAFHRKSLQTLSRNNCEVFLAAQPLDLHWLIAVVRFNFLLLEHHFLIKLAHRNHFLVRSLGPFHMRLIRARQIAFVELEIVRCISQLNFFAASKDFVPTMLFVPLTHSRVLVHVLDDVAPANPRVVGAETDLALLSAVRNDAHLSAAEVIVEKILEPHTGDE